MRDIAASIAGILVLALVVSQGDAQATRWADLQQGEVIDFLLPGDTAPAEIIETLFITGGKLLTIETTGCPLAVGQHPVQQYMLVDPTGARSLRSGGMVVSTTDPVRPGTRLGQLTFTHECEIGGVEYHYYQGTVQ